MKFKIGDKVRTEVGDGEIVFITEEFTVRYLVKIKGFDGHSGRNGYGYDNEDGSWDKWWFLERHLELLEEGGIGMKYYIKDQGGTYQVDIEKFDSTLKQLKYFNLDYVVEWNIDSKVLVIN